MIIDDRRAESCSAGCGFDWSRPDNVILARERVRARFNMLADIRYYNLSGSDIPVEVKEKYGDQASQALVINDHIRVSGQFDMRMLLEAVDAELEIGGGRG